MIQIALLNAIHKLILILGFMALLAVSTGSYVQGNIYESALAIDLFKKTHSTPSPLMIDQCDGFGLFDNEYSVLPDRTSDNCHNNKEVGREYSEGLTFAQGQ